MPIDMAKKNTGLLLDKFHSYTWFMKWRNLGICGAGRDVKNEGWCRGANWVWCYNSSCHSGGTSWQSRWWMFLCFAALTAWDVAWAERQHQINSALMQFIVLLSLYKRARVPECITFLCLSQVIVSSDPVMATFLNLVAPYTRWVVSAAPF